jgi:hypothetical protein
MRRNWFFMTFDRNCFLGTDVHTKNLLFLKIVEGKSSHIFCHLHTVLFFLYFLLSTINRVANLLLSTTANSWLLQPLQKLFLNFTSVILIYLITKLFYINYSTKSLWNALLLSPWPITNIGETSTCHTGRWSLPLCWQQLMIFSFFQLPEA